LACHHQRVFHPLGPNASRSSRFSGSDGFQYNSPTGNLYNLASGVPYSGSTYQYSDPYGYGGPSQAGGGSIVWRWSMGPSVAHRYRFPAGSGAGMVNGGP
jgi:hypothetical protein